MSSRKTKIVKELKIDDIHDIPKSKIEGYLSMGYKPYLNEKGNIKWLTEAQYSIRKLSENRHENPVYKLRPFRRKKSRKSRLKNNFLLENWALILFIIVFLFAILVLYKYPHIIF